MKKLNFAKKIIRLFIVLKFENYKIKKKVNNFLKNSFFKKKNKTIIVINFRNYNFYEHKKFLQF